MRTAQPRENDADIDRGPGKRAACDREPHHEAAGAGNGANPPRLGLNHDSPIPLHFQLKEALIDRIIRSGMKPGDRFWTEKELCNEYKVSRTTVRQALDAMVDMGIIKRRRGLGTVLVRPPIPEHLPRLVGLTEEMRAQGRTVQTQVLEASWVEPPPAVRSALAWPRSADRVLLLVRVRAIDGEPVFYVKEYLPEWLGLTPEDDFTGSLFALMKERAGVVISRSEMTISAVTADERIAQLLKVPPGFPLLKNLRIFYRADNTPVGYLEELCRSDRYVYSVTLRAE